MESQNTSKTDKRIHNPEIAHNIANVEAPYRDIAAIALRHPELPEMMEIAHTSKIAGQRIVSTLSRMEVVPGFEKRPRAQMVGKTAEAAQRSLQNEQWAHFAQERLPGEELRLKNIDEVNPAILAVVGQAVSELQDSHDDFAYERAWGRGLRRMPFADSLRIAGFEGALKDITMTHLPTDEDLFLKSVPQADRGWPNTEVHSRVAISATMMSENEQPIGQRVIEAYVYKLDFKKAGKRVFHPRINAALGKTASVVDAAEKLTEYNARRPLG